MESVSQTDPQVEWVQLFLEGQGKVIPSEQCYAFGMDLLGCRIYSWDG